MNVFQGRDGEREGREERRKKRKGRRDIQLKKKITESLVMHG